MTINYRDTLNLPEDTFYLDTSISKQDLHEKIKNYSE